MMATQTKKTITNNEFNLGLAILKVFLSFLVIIIHCFDINSTSNTLLVYIYGYRFYVVPTFYLISFLFYE